MNEQSPPNQLQETPIWPGFVFDDENGCRYLLVDPATVTITTSEVEPQKKR